MILFIKFTFLIYFFSKYTTSFNLKLILNIRNLFFSIRSMCDVSYDYVLVNSNFNQTIKYAPNPCLCIAYWVDSNKKGLLEGHPSRPNINKPIKYIVPEKCHLEKISNGVWKCTMKKITPYKYAKSGKRGYDNDKYGKYDLKIWCYKWSFKAAINKLPRFCYVTKSFQIVPITGCK